jgi:hypothetical protein
VTDPQFQLDFDTADMPHPSNPMPKAKRKPRNSPAAKLLPQPAAELTPQAMAAALEKNPDYRVLRRLVPTLHFDRVAQGPVVRLVVLDTETTGLEPRP